ncbi:hypothetical protein FLL45_11555 [Aliikangiella marina]|uniref:ABC transporter substrate-binding protein n=1 Tax=Aliikangiella marina TaxID=1712262 RepID=A0A545TE98_9GAMM|nr:hypothetical protein [Aliikangiella marina]TQV75544.1 hypothetical protein FLL45_11555 [Aliikangiella marina]
MNAFKTFILILLVVLSSKGFAYTDSDAIQKLFKEYKALITKNDPTTIDRISQETIKYFGHTLELVKYATKQELLDASLLEHSNAILYRHVLPKNKLANITPQALFQFSVINGFSGEGNYSRMAISHVVVDDKKAFANMTFDGRGIPNRFYFKKEAGEWKVDLIAMLLDSERFLEFEFKKNKVPKSDFVLGYIKYVTQTPVPNEIYIPPFQK